MFKRVGATILTIVMLLSMASVVSSAETAPMSLAVELVDGVGNPLNIVAPGDAVNAIVKIKNPVALSGMAVAGTYDADLFAADGAPEIYNVHTDGSALTGQIDQSGNNILAAWYADSNVTAEDGATLLVLPLVVKEEAVLGAADITFSFVEDEMLIENGGTPAPLPAAEYSAEQVPASVTIAKATSLEVVAPADAKVGKTISVKVNVKDYAGSWSAMTILGSYDATKLELQDITPILGDGLTQAPAIETEPGKVAVAWFDDEVIDQDANFTALELTFKVLESGDTNLSFSFDEEGIYGENENAPISAGFSKEAVKANVELKNPAPKATLDVKVPADVKVGDTITVKVDVKNYASEWSAMTILGKYDANKLELKTVAPVLGNDGDTQEPVIEKANGKVAVAWFDDEVIVKDSEFTALELTFLVKEEGTADLSFAFDPEGMKGANGEEVPADEFDAEEKAAVIEIVSADPPTYLVVDVVEESAKVGQTINVKVDVKDYAGKWMMMTILGKYDASKLELQTVNPILGNAGDTEEPVVEKDPGKVGVIWFDDDVIEMGSEFTALELTFLVKAEGTATVEFFFEPEGLKDADGEEVSADAFDSSKKSASIELETADPPTYLVVDAVEESAKVGETVKVKVNVKDYAGKWMMMTILGKYDASKLELQEIVPILGNAGDTEEPVVETDPGKIAVTWFDDEVINFGSEFTALELTFLVKEEGAATFEFFFEPEGLIDADGEEVSADAFIAEKASDTVTLEPADPDQVTLNVSASSDRAKLGEQITFTVNVQDYLDKWSAMAIFAKYDQSKLKYIGTNNPITGFNQYEVQPETGTVKVVWVNEEPVVLGQNFKAMEMVFEVIGEGDTAVSFEFESGGIVTTDPDGNEIHAPADSYSQDPVSKPISLITVPFLEIVGESSAILNEEYTVELNLKDYNDKWSSFGTELSYDATKFAIENIDAKVFGGMTPAVDTSVAGKISLTWSGAANIDAAKESTVLRVTFKAIGAGNNIEFNANLVDVKTFVGGANVDVDAEEYKAAAEKLIVKVKEKSVPYLSVVVEPGNAFDEGTDGVLKLYLNDYNGEWSAIPVILNFDSNLIRINEKDIVCNSLDGVDGIVQVRSEDGKIVFGWMSVSNIASSGSQIELATIPFRAHRDGQAIFGSEFVADSIKTSNGQGGLEEVEAGAFVPKAEDQTVTIADMYENTDPMFLSIGTASLATKNKKQGLTLTLNNLNSRVQALSVKLYYDKNKVSISKEDISLVADSDAAPGEFILNEEEGFIHLTILAAENISDEDILTLLNLEYTPKVEGQISFYAEIELLGDTDENPMDPLWDYEVRSETVEVKVESAPSLSATANNKNVKIGDTVFVTVSVNDYKNLWSAMTITGSYNKNLLRLKSITPTNFFNAANITLSHDEETGTFSVSWSGSENIATYEAFDAIVLTFQVIDCGTAEFEFAFGDVLTNGSELLVPDVDYIVDAEPVDQINIQICDHIWSDSIVHKDGTSGEASKHILTCTKGCGVIKEVACSITKTNGRPTCDKPGTITYDCSICGYNEMVNNPNIPALGHKFDSKPAHKAGTKKHIYTCSVCGDTKEENCSFRKLVVERDCMNDGYTLNTCTICSYSYKSNIVKAEGKHGALVLHYIAPTATTNGSIITQCDTCRQYVAPPYAGAVKKTLKAGHPFPDVQDPNMWYYDAVKFSKAFEIFGGDDKGNFNPDANITRGQLVTVLGRIMMAEAEKTMSDAQFNAFLKAQTSKVSGMKSASGFTDLSGKYYERYAKLFAKWGIVNGYPDGTFGGDKNITREEMATLIKRFIEADQGSTENVKFGKAATFKDFSKVSGWAKSNVQWVGKVGLFQGDTNRNYNPASNATRAEIAVVIERMLPVLKNICVCSENH